MAKRRKKCPPPAPSWLATFADLSTLLMTFFVLLISMATFNPVKFAQVLGYFQTPTGMGYDIPTPQDPITTEQFFVQIVRASAIRQETPEGGYRPSLAGENIRVTSFKDNYIVRFTERPFFDRFQLTLTDEGRRRLEVLAQKLKGSVNIIYVIGRVAQDENTEQFDQVLQTVQLKDGTAARVLATRFDRYMKVESRPVLRDTETALIQSRTELAAKRAEAVSDFLQAAGIDPRRIRETAGQDYSSPSEEIREGEGNFVFAYGGTDSGRTAEIVVTGEIVTE